MSGWAELTVVDPISVFQEAAQYVSLLPYESLSLLWTWTSHGSHSIYTGESASEWNWPISLADRNLILKMIVYRIIRQLVRPIFTLLKFFFFLKNHFSLLTNLKRQCRFKAQTENNNSQYLYSAYVPGTALITFHALIHLISVTPYHIGVTISTLYIRKLSKAA